MSFKLFYPQILKSNVLLLSMHKAERANFLALALCLSLGFNEAKANHYRFKPLTV